MVTTPAQHAEQADLLRDQLAKRNWPLALEAMEFAQRHHSHLRKDGVTPEFSHQVQISLMLLDMLPHLQRPQTTLVVALLHDVCEDYDVRLAQIEAQFGPEAREGVDIMTKVYQGSQRDPEEVSKRQSAHAVSSVVKGADRIHNQSTMVGVFTRPKIAQYVAETQHYIIPMIADATQHHPQQRPAYITLMGTLNAQIANV